ncbi:unnamed protein product [Dicrocoelium dendriticum]|nr:unnamed protein product [Dicrocoelium dendriticum]
MRSINFELAALILLGLVTSVRSYTFMIPFSYDESGNAFVEFNGTIYNNAGLQDTEYTDDSGCTVKLNMRPPTPEEQQNHTGYIAGSRLCLSWFFRTSTEEVED